MSVRHAPIDPAVGAILFDLDGTLADTAGEIGTALGATFRELGLAAPAPASVERLIGRGTAALVERALGAAAAHTDLAVALRRFESHYAGTVGTTATLYPDTLEGLHLLRARGRAMAVVTNKPRAFSERLLDRLRVRDVFSVLVAGDDGFAKKPGGDMLAAAMRSLDRRPGETLMIGDSDNDVMAARAAGCRVWCVPYGYNEGRPAATLACDRLVATIGEAARLVLGIAEDASPAGRQG